MGKLIYKTHTKDGNIVGTFNELKEAMSTHPEYVSINDDNGSYLLFRVSNNKLIFSDGEWDNQNIAGA